jgi:Rps23 Pro-64 3,4-dihydroxylase Tpa1-like proline 4-hydroxylase
MPALRHNFLIFITPVRVSCLPVSTTQNLAVFSVKQPKQQKIRLCWNGFKKGVRKVTLFLPDLRQQAGFLHLV